MPCILRKDESRLIAKTRMAPFWLKHCVYVYIWSDKDAMLKAISNSNSSYMACTCYMPWRESHGGKSKLFPKKVAELHFYSGAWDEEAVAHESTHAAMQLAMAYQLSPDYIFNKCSELSAPCSELIASRDELNCIDSDEEFFCYLVGVLTIGIYRWLWQNDTPNNWVRVDE